MMDTPEGQEGYCVLPDGRRCELWESYSSKGGECIPVSEEDPKWMDEDEA